MHWRKPARCGKQVCFGHVQFWQAGLLVATAAGRGSTLVLNSKNRMLHWSTPFSQHWHSDQLLLSLLHMRTRKSGTALQEVDKSITHTAALACGC